MNKITPSGEQDGIIGCNVEGETDAWITRLLDDQKGIRPMDWETETILVDDIGGGNAGAFEASKGAKANVTVKEVVKKGT